MEIALDFIREKMSVLLARIEDGEYENIAEASHFYSNIEKLKNQLLQNQSEAFYLQIFFQLVLSNKETDFQYFMPMGVQYPFNKQEFLAMSKAVYTNIWGEFNALQDNSFLDNYCIKDIPEEQWEFIKNNANDLGF